jgi:hypothetical protein
MLKGVVKMEHNINNQIERISSQPSLKLNKAIGAAMKKIAPMIKEAQKKILSLPLKPIVDPHTGTSNLVRFATSEELQRIVMETCSGMISVTTLPIMLGNKAVVRAFVLITTTEGLYQLGGSSGAQDVNTLFTDKAILSAESRALRRALRDQLNLRAEYEVYDTDEQSRQSEIDNAPDFDFSEPVKEEINSNVAVTSKTTPVKAAPPKKVVKKPRAKKVDVSEKNNIQLAEFSAEPIKIEVDSSVAGWPDKRATSYLSKLLDGLESVRKGKCQGMSVEKFVKEVLGTSAFGNARGNRRSLMTSLVTDELEKLYQHYVIDKDEL